MKKVILIAAVFGAIFSSTAFAGHHGNMTRTYCYSSCQYNYCDGRGSNYMDCDGDGICDNCGTQCINYHHTASHGCGGHRGGHCR